MMTEKEIKSLKEATWLIEKLAGSLGVDLDELPEHYNNSYEELWDIIKSYQQK